VQQGFHGTVDAGGGSFGTATGSFTGAYGSTSRAISFSASGARTSRYLDPPVVDNFTNDGALGGVTVSFQDRPSDTDRLRFTWHRRGTRFLVPNEPLQEAAGQRQERTGREDLGQMSWARVVNSRWLFNARGVAERMSATLDSNAQSTPIVVEQQRSLTRGYANASVAADLGRHHVKFGGDLLFATVGEDLTYAITDPSMFDPGTPMMFQFSERARDREQSLFAQDTVTLGPLTASAGLRWDHYSVVVNDRAFSPRLGVAWSAAGGDLVLRAAYDRAFQTPAIENLLLASSPAVDALGSVRIPIQPSRGNFFEAGATAALADRARLDVTAYRRLFANFADDDVFLNTGVSFPVAFHSAKIHGVDAKLSILPWHRTSGSLSYSLLKGTSQFPVVGGLFLGEEALEELEEVGEVSITQDQRHTIRGQVRFALNERAWITSAVRFGSGLPVELDDSADEDLLDDQYGDDILARVDLDRGRVRPNFSVDVGVGANLWRRDRRRLVFRMEAANFTNRLNVINFAGVFSGTALGAPRSLTARVQLEF
jgi:outer membrane receptor for Fe3+-dicitrate